MMRYLLYETEHQTTLLSKELVFLGDYIELMQLRLSDKVNLHFETPIQLRDVQLAPMLFLPFVENAFKHGISGTQPSEINISITQYETLLTLDVRNTVFDEPRTGASPEGSGIGLANTRRRLDLMYAGKYRLDVNQRTAENYYEVKLTLNLE